MIIKIVLEMTFVATKLIEIYILYKSSRRSMCDI